MSKVSIGTDGKLLIEEAKILYRNFSGAQTDYNREGDRNFNVIIDDPETAKAMQNDGWNVKFRPGREDEPGTYHIKVNVNYKSARAPKIYLHAGDAPMQMLDEATVGDLDNLEILAAHMLISPYHWERNGSTGVSAYLDTMHVDIKEDPFAHKYANLNG